MGRFIVVNPLGINGSGIEVVIASRETSAFQGFQSRIPLPAYHYLNRPAIPVPSWAAVAAVFIMSTQLALASTPLPLEIAVLLIFRWTGADCFGSFMIFSPCVVVVWLFA